MTPFFRRDKTLSVAVRDHIVRSRAELAPAYNTPRGVGSGIPTPGTGGTLEGRAPRDGGGSRNGQNPSGTAGTLQRGAGGGTVGDFRREKAPGTATTPAPVTRDSNWRNRDSGGSGSTRRGGDTPATSTTPAPDRAN